MTKKPFFDYDLILSLNASQRLRSSYSSVSGKYKNKKILAATFDHRFYSLADKNFMKNFIDLHGLAHYLFTMRPTSKELVESSFDLMGINEFKDISQVIFVMQLMGRYNISHSIVDTSFLDFGGNTILNFSDLRGQVFDFLDKLRNIAKDECPEKKFPALFSIEKIDYLMGNKSIELLERISINESMHSYDYSAEKISELEKNLFWVGFDAEFKGVDHERTYPNTKWTRLAGDSELGRGLFDKNLKYCARCCLPETMEGISLDEFGICIPCRNSEEKMHINWEEKKDRLNGLIEAHRSVDYYDCMLPMSGGKDSTFQAHLLRTNYDVTILAVTHGQNWYSLEGRYNLENCLQKFDLDHMIFNMERSTINNMARKSLAEIGDVCWHCHIGAGTFPVTAALVWDIKLMCWGESIAEADGRGSYKNQSEASLFYNLEVSARIKAEDMVDAINPAKTLSPWFYPPKEVLKNSNLRYIHLGDYFFWDEARQVEFIKRNYEWMDSKVENTYKGYKSVECVMAGLHDYANFIKRGIGRATIHASEDVRRGLLTREEGFELAKKYDTQRPHVLDYYLKITGISEDEFEKTLYEAREKSEYAIKLNKVEKVGKL
jgi:N-acetyl sugar amidotransferase